ncbi:MAG: AMP-binding protein [Dehalococcoidia bacterium]|nr:AMP-binding protein [Dehalococcoidia bacterium]
MTLTEMLEQTLRVYPDKPAVVSDAGVLTCREFDEVTNRLAHMLLGLGLKQGDAVAVLMPPIADWLVGYFGATKAGARVVILNAMLTPAELGVQLLDSGSTIVLTESRFAQALAASAGDEPSPVSHVLPLDDEAFKQTLATFPSSACGVQLKESDECSVLYTSGVLGKQKGVVHTHSSLMAVAEVGIECMGLEPDWVVMGMIPFFHVLGLETAFASLRRGCTIVVAPRFTVKNVLESVRRHRVSIIVGVPAMFNALSMVPEETLKEIDLSSLHVAMTAGAKSSPVLMEELERKYNLVLTEIYGTTETPIICMGGLRNRRLGTAGQPTLDFKVIGEDGKEVPRGHSGQAVCRGPQVMVGYFKAPELTALVLRNGWFYTGDIVTMDEDGYVTYVEKQSFIIVTSSGVKIPPTEVEEVALTHPAVAEVAYVGVVQDDGGQLPILFVALREGQEVSRQTLRAYCAESLAVYKLPQRIEFVEELPKIASGKIDRRHLQAWRAQRV